MPSSSVAKRSDPQKRTSQSLYAHISAPKATRPPVHRVLVGTPTLGVIRIEWHNCFSGLVVPCNWSNSSQTPIGFLVDDAQNLIAHHALVNNFEWMMLVEDDVLVPPDMLIKFEQYLRHARYPIVSGLYFLKTPGRKEPLIYRGRGVGPYIDWMTPGWEKRRPKLWVDGVPTGCLLIHMSIIRTLAEISEDYQVRNVGSHLRIKRIFQTPREAWADQGTQTYQKLIGTSDLYFCDKIIDNNILAKAGWPSLSRKEYPFLVDTGILCGHIERTNGVVY